MDSDREEEFQLNVDQAQELAGDGHQYQVKIIFYFFLIMLFSSFITNSSNIFLRDPQIQCVINGQIQNCSINEMCENHYEYKQTSKFSSMKTDYDLLCSQNFYIEFRLMTYLGLIFGSLYSGFLMEDKGRIKSFIHFLSLYLFFLIVCLLLRFTFILLLSQLLMSFALQGIINTAIVYSFEISSENLRILGPLFIIIGTVLSRVVISILSLIILDWKIIYSIISFIPLLLMCYYTKYLVEVPRFLICHKKFQDAIQSIKYIAKVNQRNIPSFQFKEEIKIIKLAEKLSNLTKTSLSNINVQYKKHFFQHMFKYKSIRVKVILVLISWFLLHFSNSSIDKIFYQFQQDEIINHIVISVLYFLGCLIAMYLLLNFERKKILKFLFLIISILFFLITMVYFANIQNLFILKFLERNLYTFLKVGISVARNIMIIISLEQFPTIIRHLSISLFFAVSWIGNLITVKFESIDEQKYILTFILGISYLLMIFYFDKLKETFLTKIQNDLLEEEETLISNNYSFQLMKNSLFLIELNGIMHNFVKKRSRQGLREIQKLIRQKETKNEINNIFYIVDNPYPLKNEQQVAYFINRMINSQSVYEINPSEIIIPQKLMFERISKEQAECCLIIGDPQTLKEYGNFYDFNNYLSIDEFKAFYPKISTLSAFNHIGEYSEDKLYSERLKRILPNHPLKLSSINIFNDYDIWEDIIQICSDYSFGNNGIVPQKIEQNIYNRIPINFSYPTKFTLNKVGFHLGSEFIQTGLNEIFFKLGQTYFTHQKENQECPNINIDQDFKSLLNIIEEKAKQKNPFEFGQKFLISDGSTNLHSITKDRNYKNLLIKSKIINISKEYKKELQNNFENYFPDIFDCYESLSKNVNQLFL